MKKEQSTAVTAEVTFANEVDYQRFLSILAVAGENGMIEEAFEIQRKRSIAETFAFAKEAAQTHVWEAWVDEHDEDDDDSWQDEWRREMAMEAGMLGGCDAYNDTMGY